MVQESAHDAFKKIPDALKNLSGQDWRVVQNYIENLVLTCLRDKQLRDELSKDEEAAIKKLTHL